jgi:hypothetical protein
MMCSQRATGLGDHRVLLAPSVVKGLERLGGGFGVDGAVDGLEIGGDALAVLVDDVAHSRSNLMDDARLPPTPRGRRPRSPPGTRSAVDAGRADVLDTG